MEKLLIHICCAGCGAYIAKALKEEYDTTLFFYNPNIFPQKEHDFRLKEARGVAERLSLNLITVSAIMTGSALSECFILFEQGRKGEEFSFISPENSSFVKGENYKFCKLPFKKFGLVSIREKNANYGHDKWLDAVRGFELDPERGARCGICYQYRLEETAYFAKKNGFEIFSSTLTISPHKDAKKIFEIGHALEEKCGVKFLDRDFKKQDGFKKSTAMSKDLGLYRQNYCGCEFSRRGQIVKKN
jgi:epoxyqueuosine reductase